MSYSVKFSESTVIQNSDRLIRIQRAVFVNGPFSIRGVVVASVMSGAAE